MTTTTAPSTTRTATTIGPLTTTFTPPAFCNTPLWHCDSSGGCGIQPRAFSCSGRTSSRVATDCYPGGTEDQWLQLELDPVFAPGLMCPLSWSSACQTVGSDAATTVECCPFGYVCGTATRRILSLRCVSTQEVGTSSAVINHCVDGTLVPQDVLYEVRTEPIRGSEGESSQLSLFIINGTSTLGALNATWDLRPIKLVAPNTAIPTPTPTQTLSAEQGQDSINNTPEQKPRPTPPTKIIIGVLIPVLLLLVAVAAFCYIRRRKRGKIESKTYYGPTEIHESTTATWLKPELDGTVVVTEVSSKDKASTLELEGTTAFPEPVELDSGIYSLRPHELEAHCQQRG